MVIGATDSLPGGVLVVIVNYRTAGLVCDCLDSLSGQISQLPDSRVMVVDNASGDGSAEQIRQHISRQNMEWGSVVSLDHNGGYAAGNNAGIKAGWGPGVRLVWLLNPDTVARAGAAEELLRFMEQHPGVGIAGSGLEDQSGAAQGSAHSLPTVLGELAGAARTGLVSRILMGEDDGRRQCQTPRACGWVSGASLMIRREALEAIGLLDEGFFLYFDEVDYCMRAGRSGWEVWQVPASRVMHLEGQSTGIKNPRRRRRAQYWYQSRRRFFIKYYGRLGLLAADCLWAVGRGVALLRYAVGHGGGVENDPAWFTFDLLVGDLLAVVGGDDRLGDLGWARRAAGLV